jgi:hypothetical protein
MIFIGIGNLFDYAANELNNDSKYSSPDGSLLTKKSMSNSASSKTNARIFTKRGNMAKRKVHICI